MGRIETEGTTLVDLKETVKLIGHGRSTVFRLKKRGYLVAIKVAGDRKTYFTLESIERVKERYKGCLRLKDRRTVQPAASTMDLLSSESKEDQVKRRALLGKLFPDVFPHCATAHR